MDNENRMVHLAIAVEGQIDIQVAIAQAHMDIYFRYFNNRQDFSNCFLHISFYAEER